MIVAFSFQVSAAVLVIYCGTPGCPHQGQWLNIVATSGLANAEYHRQQYAQGHGIPSDYCPCCHQRGTLR